MKISPYERVRLWRLKNPKKAKAQWRRYYLAHAEEIKSKKKAVYKLMKNEKDNQNTQTV